MMEVTTVTQESMDLVELLRKRYGEDWVGVIPVPALLGVTFVNRWYLQAGEMVVVQVESDSPALVWVVPDHAGLQALHCVALGADMSILGLLPESSGVSYESEHVGGKWRVQFTYDAPTSGDYGLQITNGSRWAMWCEYRAERIQ